MREAALQAKAPWAGVDVVFIAREKTSRVGLDAVVRDMEALGRRLQEEK
jgi:ribonuclease P protein component